jgi:homoserine dehydrogenase
MTAPSTATGSRVTARPLRVALLGLGTVGREVARGLLRRELQPPSATAGRAAPGHTAAGRGVSGRELRLVAVADRDQSRLEGLDLTDVECVDDGARLVGGPDVDVIVELIGGVEGAGRLVASALDAGHSVVTANKALLARRGAELEHLARSRNVALRFEAAVGGGIPVLSPLAADLEANRIMSVRGIVNGSTNHVLTSLTGGTGSYDDAVVQARSLGYLEADASADLEGKDAADKLAILVRLAFGAWPDVTAIRRAPPAMSGSGGPGITGVSRAVIDAARRFDLVVKLVATATLTSDGRILAAVVPAAVPAADPLARTDGAENRIEIDGEPVGKVAFVGQGAGGTATSSAVLGDVLAIARGRGSTWGGLPEAGLLDPGRLVDGLDEVRSWLAVGPGEPSLVGPASLEDARRHLGRSRPDLAASADTVLVPVLEAR